jgi:hypothetical protein
MQLHHLAKKFVKKSPNMWSNPIFVEINTSLAHWDKAAKNLRCFCNFLNKTAQNAKFAESGHPDSTPREILLRSGNDQSVRIFHLRDLSEMMESILESYSRRSTEEIFAANFDRLDHNEIFT